MSKHDARQETPARNVKDLQSLSALKNAGFCILDVRSYPLRRGLKEAPLGASFFIFLFSLLKKELNLLSQREAFLFYFENKIVTTIVAIPTKRASAPFTHALTFAETFALSIAFFNLI